MTYDELVARADLSYVRAAGEAIQARLANSSQPVALVYAPRGFDEYLGVRLELLFIPPRGIQLVTEMEELPFFAPDLTGIVVNGSDFAWAHLAEGITTSWDWTYNNLGGSIEELAALTALFRAIAGVEIRG